jgi:ABC-2 type transport system permease protein
MTRCKENFVALSTIVRREVSRFLRIWTQTLLPPVISMTLYFVIFGNLIGNRIGNMSGVTYMQYIVPGLVMMSIITSSYMNVVSSFFVTKFQRNIEEMIVSPMPSQVIFWGFILGGVIRGLMVGTLVFLVASLFTTIHVNHVGTILLVALLAALLFSIAGLLNGIFAKKFDDINIIPTFVITPLTYLGGVFYSIILLPSFWQKVTYLNPIFYMVNAFRFGMSGPTDVPVTYAITIMSILTLCLYALSIQMLNRGVGVKT